MKLKSLSLLAIAGVVYCGLASAHATEGAKTAQKPEQQQAAAKGATPALEAPSLNLKVPIFSPQFAQFPVAMVNDEKITLEELTKSLGSVHEDMTEGKTARKKDFADLLKRLINSQLIIQEGRNMGLDQLEEVKKAVDSFRKKLLRETLLKEQVKDVKVPEKDLEKAYREETREWQLKSIIFEKEADAKAMEKGLKGGKKFDALFDAAIKAGSAKEGGKASEFITRENIHPVMLKMLLPMKEGQVSDVLPLEKGFLVFRVEGMKSKDDPAVKEKVHQDLLTKARLKTLENFRDGLIKKYAKKNKKLIDKLDFEAKKPGFESFLTDKRAIVEIKGEAPVTVADLAEAIKAKFFHGVEQATKSKKVNKSKEELILQILETRVIEKEARERKLDKDEALRAKVKSYENSLVFGTFVDKVIKPEIKLTDDELQAYYREHAKEFTSEAKYKLDAITFKTAAEAEAAVEKLRQGMDFKWFKANADGHITESEAVHNLFEGDFVLASDMPESFQKTLTGAVTGDYRVVAGPTESYAVYVQEVSPLQTLPFSVVEGDIRKAIFFKKLNADVESWAEKLRNASDVTIYADFGQ